MEAHGIVVDIGRGVRARRLHALTGGNPLHLYSLLRGVPADALTTVAPGTVQSVCGWTSCARDMRFTSSATAGGSTSPG